MNSPRRMRIKANENKAKDNKQKSKISKGKTK